MSSRSSIIVFGSQMSPDIVTIAGTWSGRLLKVGLGLVYQTFTAIRFKALWSMSAERAFGISLNRFMHSILFGAPSPKERFCFLATRNCMTLIYLCSGGLARRRLGDSRNTLAKPNVPPQLIRFSKCGVVRIAPYSNLYLPIRLDKERIIDPDILVMTNPQLYPVCRHPGLPVW